jgi:uncharacterized repeat protein (TIGR01451 family)
MRSRALTSEGATDPNRASRGPKSRRTTKRLAVMAALVVAAVTALAAVGGASAMVRAFSSSVQHLSARHVAAVAIPLPSSVQLYQWETVPSSDWTTGNLGDHNSAYTEGQVIPFRLDVSGITAGSYSFAVCRDFVNGTTYGYLHLAPFETDYTTDAGTTASSGDFSYTSGISSLTGTDTGAFGGCGAGHVETDVTFTTDGTSNQFIYWGGYLAAPLDAIPAPGSGTVGFQHSAGFYSGASLHMVLLSPNKDRSINPGSIVRLAEITASKVVDSGTAPPASWCFTIDAGPEAGSCKTPNVDLLGSDGLADSYQFLALPGGTYHITESTVAGYAFDHGVNTLNCPFTGSTAVPVVTASTAGTTNATCEFHNKLSKTTPTVVTTLKNAANDADVANGTALALNSSLYDTAAVTATGTLTGKVTFEFFHNSDCTAPATASDIGVAVGTKSSTQGPLAAGSYSFHAMYVAGTDPNHNDSAWSTCEPFSIGKGTPTVETTLHSGTTEVALNSTLDINSSVYDTAAVTAGDQLPLTGTVSYEFFNNGNCTAPATASDTLVAVGTQSSTQGPLSAGSYSFHAKYVAGEDPNHISSDWSACEPFSIGKGTPTVETTLKNAADDGTVDLNSTLDINSSVYDTAAVTATDGLDLTGTVSYQFFNNSSCDGEVASESVSVGTESSTQGPLAAGSYSFQAKYFAGEDPNHTNSDWSACEPFSIGKGTPSIDTTLHNASGDTTVELNSTLPINSSVYDTAAVTASDELDLTGTVSYQFFANGTCSGEVTSETGIALDAQSSTQGPLSTGSYSFRAMYVAGNDPNHNSSDWSACEPFSVGKAKPALTTTPSAGGTIGTSVHDTAVLSDSVRATGTIAFALYGVSDTTCTGTPVFTGSANVAGNGSVDSASYTPTAAGTYRWVATYSGDANNEAAASKCGDELVTITNPPVTPPPPAPPAPVIDLAITKAGSPNPATLGKNVTWTMVVTNNGPNDATGVTVADPVPAGTTYVSSSATQGTCTGGVVVTCNLGNVAKGASVTVTLVTTATATGSITNTTTVVGNEHDSNTTNNTATATVNVKGAFVPPVIYCTAVAVTPKSLSAGRANKLTLKVAQHGRAAVGVRIRIKGASVNVVTKPSNAKGIVKQTIKPSKAGIVTFSPVSVKSCKNVRVGILGVFTPPVTG